MFKNVTYRPTVYKSGVNAVQFGKIFWHTPKFLLFYKENLMTSIFQTPRLLPDFAPVKNTLGKNFWFSSEVKDIPRNSQTDQYLTDFTFSTFDLDLFSCYLQPLSYYRHVVINRSAFHMFRKISVRAS